MCVYYTMLSSNKTTLTTMIEHIKTDTAVTFAPRRFPINSAKWQRKKKMSTEHWWNDTSRGNAKYGEETPLWCHCLYHNPQMFSMGLNSVLRGEWQVTNAMSHCTNTSSIIGWDEDAKMIACIRILFFHKRRKAGWTSNVARQVVQWAGQTAATLHLCAFIYNTTYWLRYE